MSFLSRKYMQHRESRVIDEDIHCRGCGYNMRGLKTGQRCPECGRPVDPDRDNGVDLLTSGDAVARRRWVVGFDLLILAMIGLIVEEVIFHVGWFGGPWNIYALQALFGVVLSITWLIGVWMVTPLEMDERWPLVRHVRRAIRLSQIGWVLGCVCLAAETAVALTPGTVAGLNIVATVMYTLAVLGVGLLAWLMSLIARYAELDADESRFTGMMFWVPALTLVVAAFPATFVWMLLVFYVPLLVAWLVTVGILALGFRALRQHVKWTERHAYDHADRESRIAATREALQADVAEQVRPTGPAFSEVTRSDSH